MNSKENKYVKMNSWTFKRHKTKNVTSYSISVLGVLSHVQLFVAPQTIAHQAPL